MRDGPLHHRSGAVCVLCGRDVIQGGHLEAWRDAGHLVRLVERG